MSNYFRFLIHQLKGWPQQNYYLFYFSLGCQVMTLVNQPITWLSIITFIGTNLGCYVFYQSMPLNQSTVF